MTEPPRGPGGAAGAPDGVLAALADPTRRQVLDLLAARGEATATVLAEGLPVSRQAVVKHLAVLDAAGLVVGTRAGREVRYAVRPEALGATARWMAALAADWDRRLNRIKLLAEAAREPEAPASEPRVSGSRAPEEPASEVPDPGAPDPGVPPRGAASPERP